MLKNTLAFSEASFKGVKFYCFYYILYMDAFFSALYIMSRLLLYALSLKCIISCIYFLIILLHIQNKHRLLLFHAVTVWLFQAPELFGKI